MSDSIIRPGLGNYHRAGGFSTPNIISDPELRTTVSKNFAKRRWLYKRCEDAMGNTKQYRY